MIVKHLESQRIPPSRFVKFTRQGNIFEIMGYEHKSEGNTVVKVDDDHYYDFSRPIFNSDGEIIDKSRLEVLHRSGDVFHLHTAENGYVYELKNYVHTDNRSQSPNELRKTFKRIRAIINTNVTDVRKCKFITLTYASNMQDPEQLKKDLANFNSRFRRYIRSLCDAKGKNKGLDFEYISVCEPQERGAWHAHIIYIFNKQIQYISNKEVERLWKNGSSERGFTTTRKIDNVDNVGAYLTAYLADVEVSDSISMAHTDKLNSRDLKIKSTVVPVYDNNGNIIGRKKKKFIKGGRLHMYPPKFHIYRCSRGIKRPTSEYTTYAEALNEIGTDAAFTFAHTVELSDGENFKNTLTYEFYNKNRRRKRRDSRTSMQKMIEAAQDAANDPYYKYTVGLLDDIPPDLHPLALRYFYERSTVILQN